jgi:hypothetical protein
MNSSGATMTIDFRALISRRTTILSIFAAACVFSAAESQAGVIVWTQESCIQGQVDQTSDMIDLALAGSGSSSATQLPITEQSEKRDRDQTARRAKAIAGLVESSGGASIPVNSSTGQAGSAPAALTAVPPAPVAAKSFSYLRERTPQLPQPPLGELLDPPKVCA